MDCYGAARPCFACASRSAGLVRSVPVRGPGVALSARRVPFGGLAEARRLASVVRGRAAAGDDPQHERRAKREEARQRRLGETVRSAIASWLGDTNRGPIGRWKGGGAGGGAARSFLPHVRRFDRELGRKLVAEVTARELEALGHRADWQVPRRLVLPSASTSSSTSSSSTSTSPTTSTTSTTSTSPTTTSTAVRMPVVRFRDLVVRGLAHARDPSSTVWSRNRELKSTRCKAWKDAQRGVPSQTLRSAAVDPPLRVAVYIHRRVGRSDSR